MTRWTGVSPANWMMSSPRSVSTERIPTFSSSCVNSISSEVRDLDLTISFAPTLFESSST